MNQKIAFVGVGRMGGNMARRLKDCGHTIAAIYDQNPAAAEIARELGAEACSSLAAVTAAADLIFTVVSNDAAQLAIFAESGDSLLTRAKGKVFINCATLTPKVHVELERRARAVGAVTLEACMASSIPQARNGTLYLMCGGDAAAFERVRPVLAELSNDPRYIGAAGSAAQVKALVNMVMNCNTAALAEGLGLGQALGLDLDLLREVFAQTGANSQVLKTDGEDMQNRAHDCYFSAEHAAKDSGIADRLALDAGLNLPLARATKEQYDRMVKLGLGQLDKSGIAELTFPGRST
ncbi:MAG TPA: NAD(P)-dependent oxidoreductase [Candidatus Didemnitutus sp.]|nr:NAD(P)-dependent oxidoreductase [Candidatus Didemnitutus sp.]